MSPWWPTEQVEGSEEEVGGDEEDGRNMEDDSINLMLEDEEKMLEDELTFNENDRHDQEDSSQRGKEHARAKEGSPAVRASADSTKKGQDAEAQDKKDSNKSKSSGDDKGKDEKPKDDRDHKTKGTSSSSSSSSSGRNLWVSGLASSTRAQDLKSVFSKYGKVTSAKIVTNAKTPGAKCYGFVTMMSSDDATKCIAQLNHTELHGRMIQVEKAKGEPGGPSRNKPSSSSSSSTRKPSDSKKESDKKKENDKTENDKSATSEKKEGQEEKAKEGEKKEERRSHSRDESTSKDDRRGARTSRSFERRGNDYKMGHQRAGRHEIMEERERQRLRARERMIREEERRRREDEVRRRNIERRQREEAERLQREREKLRIEREKIERQKHELLRLEREHQRLEREKLEREREELRRQQMSNQRRYEETRRGIKRPAEDNRDRREFFDDRKRPAPEGRSRFDSNSGPQRRNYDRDQPPARFDHNHGNHSSGGRDDMRPGVGGGSRYDDRREMRDREDRRPVDRSGPREDRDHRGPMPSRDRPRDRYSGSGMGSSGDSWRTGGGVSDSKGFGGSSGMLGGSLGASGLSGRGDSQGWRSSGGGDRWASSSSNLGLSVSDVLRSNMSHPPQPGMNSMSMPMMSQNDRFSMSSFRKY